MRKEYYLTKLKNQLYNEVATIYQHEKELEKLESKYYCLREALELLSDDNIYDIYENRFLVFTLLESSLDKNTYEQIQSRLQKIIYSYFDNSGRPTVDDDEIYDALYVFREALNKTYIELAMKVNNDRNNLNEEKNVANNYRRIQYALKHDIELRGAQVPILKSYMDSHGYTDEEQIMINEALRTHNLKSKKNLDEAPSSYIERMLNTPLRKFTIDDVVEESLGEDFFPIAKDFYTSFNQTKLEELGSFVSYLPKYEEGYAVEEFEYIYKTFMNMIIDDIFEIVDEVRDLEVYEDNDLRNAACISYSELIKKYYGVFNFFKQEAAKYPEKIQDIDEEEEVLEGDKYINTLVYMSNNGISKLEKGLKYMPAEYYGRVLSLLERKKKGDLPSSKDSVMKATNDKLKGFGKLEEDQVRILYKPLGNNVYMIIGGFTKKATKDFTGYYSLAEAYRHTNHPSVEVLISEAPTVEAHLVDYIEENKQKQSR